MADFDLNAFPPYQLAVLSARVSRSFSDSYRDRFGISIPEWRVVAHLAQSGEVSVREITDRVDMDKSKVSRAASRLEARGYVAKRVDPSDRRLVALSLTPKGNEMVAALAPMASEFEQKFLAELGADAAGFRSALERLLQATAAERPVRPGKT